MVDQAKIQKAVALIIEAIGEDPKREGLASTPQRVAEMYADLFSGLGRDPKEELVTGFGEGHREMVVVKDIPFYAMCEHHLLPFYGLAHVGYIPNVNGRVVGASKLARVVEIVAHRPQLQERMTTQIAEAIVDPGERGQRLRRASPFAFVLSSSERWAAWRAARRSEASGGAALHS